MTPSSGKHYSLPFLTATTSSPSQTLEGLFELTRCPQLASCVLPERHACRARRGGPRTPSRTTNASLDCVYVELFLWLQKLRWPGASSPAFRVTKKTNGMATSIDEGPQVTDLCRNGTQVEKYASLLTQLGMSFPQSMCAKAPEK